MIEIGFELHGRIGTIVGRGVTVPRQRMLFGVPGRMGSVAAVQRNIGNHDHLCDHDGRPVPVVSVGRYVQRCARCRRCLPHLPRLPGQQPRGTRLRHHVRYAVSVLAWFLPGRQLRCRQDGERYPVGIFYFLNYFILIIHLNRIHF